MAGFGPHDYNERDYDPSQPIFHGTPAELNPGDIVTPRFNSKLAFATRNKDIARKFSERKDKLGKVYNVEPVSHDPEHVWERNMKHGGGAHEVVSTKGFRVLSEVQFKDSTSPTK